MYANWAGKDHITVAQAAQMVVVGMQAQKAADARLAESVADAEEFCDSYAAALKIAAMIKAQ